MNEIQESKFLNWERASRDTIDVKRIYIDIAEDLVAGIMLSQLIYWHLPNKHGESKIRIVKDGKKWVAKSYSEWLHECRLSKKQAKRATEHLEELGLIETGVFHFDNKPCTHFRIIWDKFYERFSYIINNVVTDEDVVKHWETIKLDDGRSTQKLVNIGVNDQKGNLPKRTITPNVNDQKGTLQSDKKDDYCTESTTETTFSESSAISNESRDIVKILNVPTIRDLAVEERIACLYELSVSNESYIPDRYRLDYGVQLDKRKTRIPNTFQQRMLLLSSYLSNTLISQTVAGREVKAAKELEDLDKIGTYTEQRIYESVLWGIKNGKFDIMKSYSYGKNLRGVIKLLPIVPDDIRANLVLPETKKEIAKKLHQEMDSESFVNKVLEKL